jgi:hypothetical protein
MIRLGHLTDNITQLEKDYQLTMMMTIQVQNDDKANLKWSGYGKFLS